MKKSVLILLGFFSFLTMLAYSQPFGPPVYIVNPETAECKYYFAGDPKHYNPRPEGFNFTLGYTTETKCEHWYLCRGLNGSNPGIGWAEGTCVCPPNYEFNETLGCISAKPKYWILACQNTSGIWEETMPDNFNCSTYCTDGMCRRVNCSWQPGCICPQGTAWNYDTGCNGSNGSFLAAIKAWFRKLFKAS
ncbi:hypothetical protein HYV81_02940 [Candidatus Woesearchaeota archaeon]|nr:hypothetical protein [Candidatus Woesearchaeota archaeon]